jgi:hypothetical protein
VYKDTRFVGRLGVVHHRHGAACPAEQVVHVGADGDPARQVKIVTVVPGDLNADGRADLAVGWLARRVFTGYAISYVWYCPDTPPRSVRTWGSRYSWDLAGSVLLVRDVAGRGSAIDLADADSLITCEHVDDTEFARSFIVLSKDPASAKAAIGEGMQEVLLRHMKAPLYDPVRIALGTSGAVVLTGYQAEPERWRDLEV